MFLGTLGASMLGNIFKWKKSWKSWKRIETYAWKLFVPLAPSFKEYRHYWAGIFPSTFLQPVDGSKNSILNSVMNFNLFMSIFFLKNPWKIFLYSPIFLTLWRRYLQTRIKASCMYLCSQLFFKTPHKTIKFPKKLLLLQTKKYICKYDRMEVFSTDIHWKKIVFINNVQAMLLLQSESVGMHFPTIWRPEFQKFSFPVPPADASWRQSTKLTVKKLILWEENGCRQKCLDKSLRSNSTTSLGLMEFIQAIYYPE